ncbi:MAG: hypothetical protein WEA10_00165 [Actinomycetota bacterium]
MREGAGTALAIAIVAVALVTLMPLLIVVLFWVFTSGVAVARSNDPAATSAPALLIGMVGIVGMLTILLAVVMKLVGGSLTPPSKKKRLAFERAAEPDATPPPA